MATLGPERIADTLAACQAGAAEIGGAFGRAFDVACQQTLAESNDSLLEALLTEPGLLFVFRIGDSGAVALLGQSCGFLPAWAARPDATGQSKLATLATELGMLLFPEDCFPESFQAIHTANLADALRDAGVTPDAGQITLTLSADQGRIGQLHLVWPATSTELAWNAAVAAAPAVAPSPPRSAAPTPRRSTVVSEDELPSYSRSLLRIEVPLTVTLASKKQPVGKIVEIGPGSILQFEKSCEELLELEVNGHTIALGEAVKVGDKFGIRLSSLILPDERFFPVGERGR